MGDHLPGRPGLSAAQGAIEPSPALTTSPVGDSSAISTPDNAVSELRGESRGRKKNENLPPSRAREVQRAFRARRAAHLAKLEDRIVELEAENTELRRLLLLPLPDRGVLGSGPTGRGKSLKEGGVPMSERVKAKRERDRKRAEEAAKARGVTLPREASPDDDTRSKGARAASATASGKKRKYSANGEEQEEDEDHRMDGRHVSESYSATPSSSSMGLRSPSITLPTPLAGSSGLPNKQSTRLPSFSSTVTDMGGRASSYTPHLAPPSLDPISTAFLSGSQTPVSPMHSGSLDTSSAGLISAALGGGFPNDLHQPFTHQQQQPNPFGNLGASMSNQQPQDANAALLNSLLAALPGGGMSNQNGGHQFGNNQNGNNGNLPPLPELLSIILKNPELQRRVLQHQMAQKAQQNQMSQRQQSQPFPSSSTAFPSSLFGFDSFDQKATSAQDLPGFGNSGNDGLNLSRMDPSTLFNDLFNNGRNLQGNGSNSGNGNGNNHGSTFIPSLMDTINLTEPQFSSGNERPSSAGGNSNSSYDRLFGNLNRGLSNQNSHPEREFLATSPDASRSEASSQVPLPLKNIFQHGSLAGQIARPSSAPLPPNRSQSARPPPSSRSNTAAKPQDQQPISSDLKGKGRDTDSRQSAKTGDKSMPPPSSMPHQTSAGTPQPDLLHRLRHCCHLSDVHVTSDPGLLLFASRLCLAVGCEHDGKHGDSDYNSDISGNAASQEPAHDGDYLKLEAAWQLLRQHLDPPSPETDGFENLPDLSGSGSSKSSGKPIDGQNQIATGRLAAEMVLRAVRAKTQANEGEEKQPGGHEMSRWIACRKTLGMSVDNAMIMALVNGFGGNWNNIHG
ncbi:hypothetical protein NCC49_003465 [Naganishia albida]|nr:hypothetical protein NCC49_003465 [Naganishia albida]